MAPNSVWLIVLLLIGVAALFWAMTHWGRLVVRGACALLVVVVSAAAGMAVVNDYYGYYTSWSQLSADLSGSYTSFAATTVTRHATATNGHGVVESVTFPGPTSHITRPGLVYLPPQYFQKQYAHTTFPTVELLHGSPGHPSAWIIQLRVAQVMDELIAHHEIGPMILVMPTMNADGQYVDGVNTAHTQDDTYLTTDLRHDVLTHFRASTVPAEWGIAGYSSGGYAAANLALRHRDLYGAAGIMDGYFRPQDGPAGTYLANDPAALAANDPLALASHLPAGVSPLPSFWVSVGTGDSGDLAAAEAFVRAFRGVEQLSLYKAAGAGHNFYDWSGSVPRMLTWLWPQLATPALRVQFPIAGAVRQGALFPPPAPPKASPSGGRSRHPHGRGPSRGATPSGSPAPVSSPSPAATSIAPVRTTRTVLGAQG